MNETDLIRSIQQFGNRNAFAFLVRQFQSPLRSYLRLMCSGRQELADELAQDAFLKAYTQIGTFRGESKFSTWLFQIARNLFFDSKKTQQRESINEVEAKENWTPSNPDLKMELSGALYSLPAAEREVVLLSYLEGFSHQEIAGITGTPVGTIKSRLLQAKQKLVVELKGESDEA